MQMAMIALSDVIRNVSAVKSAHVRLAVTEDDAGQWILRSLLVDIFPQPWLDRSGEYLAGWSESDELNDYGRVLFYTGFVPSKDVSAWLANQSECTLTNFDPGAGQRSRVLTFRIPELQDQASSEYIFSHSYDGYPTMPWPHTCCVCDMKSPFPQTNADYARLVAPGQRLYRNFFAARAQIIHGVTDPNREHQFSDKVGVRFVTGEGWINEVRISHEHVMVHALGMALRGSRIILTGCPEFDDVECDVNSPGQYSLAIPRTPSQFEIALVRGHTALDSAVYTANPHQFSKIQPHVAVETPAVESTATGERMAFAPPELLQEAHAHVEQALPASPIKEPQASGGNTSKSRHKRSPSSLPGSPTVLRVVVASPSDVQQERDCLPRVIDELNHGLAGQLALRLELWRWETDTSPGFHAAGPQGRIDDAMRIEDSQIVIGIFWRRFGTPVEDAQSGTEHELRRAIESWRETRHPHIMIYFNQEPYNPTSVSDLDQWRDVLTFRGSLPREGFWWHYQGSTEFERYVRQHLQQYLREKYGRIG